MYAGRLFLNVCILYSRMVICLMAVTVTADTDTDTATVMDREGTASVAWATGSCLAFLVSLLRGAKP